MGGGNPRIRAGNHCDGNEIAPHVTNAGALTRRRRFFAGAALASALFASTMLTAPARAQQAVFIPLSFTPVTATNTNNCIFVGTCALINTTFPGASIDFTNSGDFATIGFGSIGILTNTLLGGGITIDNSGNLATAGVDAIGIFANTTLGGSVKIDNSGNLATIGAGAIGISANTTLGGSVDIQNSGDIATAGFGAIGIVGNTIYGGSVEIGNSGDIATIGAGAIGISATTLIKPGKVAVENSGNLATLGAGSIGIFATTLSRNSDISIVNTGDVTTRGIFAYGLFGTTFGPRSDITVTNGGTLATRAADADGVYAFTVGRNSDIEVTNTGEIGTSGIDAEGLYLTTIGRNSNVSVDNSGSIETRGAFAEGVSVATYGRNADVTIANSGEIETQGLLSDGIYAYTGGRRSALTIENSGSVHAGGRRAYGIYAVTVGNSSPITVNNSGGLFGSTAALFAYSATSTTINNSGDISAGSGLAIDTEGASSFIGNSGLITGFVDLTDSADVFKNMSGGEFHAQDVSNFRDGNDHFMNAAGATLRTADRHNANEVTRFIGLERFENRGLVTMVDGQIGDQFRISNTPGGTDTVFTGSNGSTLGVDTFLGGPGSKSDTLVIEGSAKGRTRLAVNNVNPGPGRLNREGIPVVFVDGNVNASNFYLDKPIDTGFFEYDLVFVPTGSGFFELRSHASGGAHVLPQIVTSIHQTFHSSTETWFDQTTDLRALLARGSVCDDISRPEERIRCQDLYDAAPAVWARGAGSWFDFDGNATTTANGKTYRYDLGRELNIWQVETGMDFGKEAVLTPDDILVLGVLGGAVKSALDYNALARSYDISSLEAGAYATYLRGGFFLDTLFKAFFGTMESKGAVEFPETLDTQTYGLRVDSGYRFGGVKDGPFVEPLATVAVSWTHIDDFSHRGNTIDFSDDEQVRGRLGMRVGTSSQIWEGTTFEPFLIGSVWGLLSDDSSAKLTSMGNTFVFTDEPDDVWGEISGGVNFFNPEAQTAVFAKMDYIFADNSEGVSAKAGMRISW